MKALLFLMNGMIYSKIEQVFLFFIMIRKKRLMNSYLNGMNPLNKAEIKVFAIAFLYFAIAK
jgi:hypothetical protein